MRKNTISYLTHFQGGTLKLWKKIGTVAFWISWPLLRLYPAWGKRTRVLVICGDRLVVVKAWLGTNDWALPGGGLHPNEPSKQGAVRELKEETGLTVTASQLNFLFEATHTKHGLPTSYECFALELTDLATLTPRLFEITEAIWIDKGMVNQSNASPDVCQAIAAWFKG